MVVSRPDRRFAAAARRTADQRAAHTFDGDDWRHTDRRLARLGGHGGRRVELGLAAFVIDHRGSLLRVVEEAFSQCEGRAELDDLVERLAVDLRLRASARHAQRAGASSHVHDDGLWSKDLAGNGGRMATELEPSRQIHTKFSGREGVQ